MKVKAYIRVARSSHGKPRVTATQRPSSHPMTDTDGTPLPTVAFAVQFDVPDVMFRQAEQLIATVEITQAHPLATVTEIDPDA